MIRVLIGDLFGSDAQTLVNTVNCVGIMGKGVALSFKQRFPDMFEDYVERCGRKEVRLGKPYLYTRLTAPWILNFPTKDHWRSVSRLSDIVAGLEYLAHHCEEWGITSLAVPPLGCGQGQLEWRVVGPTLYRHLARLDIPVDLYAPHGTPAEELGADFLSCPLELTEPGGASKYRPSLKPEEVALVAILARIEREPYHWPIGRTAFQKIAYFATMRGLPTGLRYSRGSFGPFCAKLKPLLTRLANNGLIREERLGRMFAVRTGLTFADAARAFASELTRWSNLLDSVADLFLRMNTQDAEIAATAHFAAGMLRAGKLQESSESDVLNAVLQWKQKRRPPLRPEEIARAVRSLNLLGWVRLTPCSDLPVASEAMVDV